MRTYRKNSKSFKILAVASGGGHWIQLLRLRSAWDGYVVTYLTVNGESISDVGTAKFYTIPDATRWTRIALVKCFFCIFRIIVIERPSVVITTGAAPGLLSLIIAKPFGARTMWIDSIANVSKISLSGKLAKYFSDEWLTQWPDLAMMKGPYYHGEVL